MKNLEWLYETDQHVMEFIDAYANYNYASAYNLAPREWLLMQHQSKNVDRAVNAAGQAANSQDRCKSDATQLPDEHIAYVDSLKSLASRMLATITNCANFACNPYSEYLKFAAKGFAEDFATLDAALAKSRRSR